MVKRWRPHCISLQPNYLTTCRMRGGEAAALPTCSLSSTTKLTTPQLPHSFEFTRRGSGRRGRGHPPCTRLDWLGGNEAFSESFQTIVRAFSSPVKDPIGTWMPALAVGCQGSLLLPLLSSPNRGNSDFFFLSIFFTPKAPH